MGLTPAEGIPEGIPQVMGGLLLCTHFPVLGSEGCAEEVSPNLCQPIPGEKFPPLDMHLKLATQYAPPESPTRGQGGRAENKNNAAPAFRP